MRNCRVGNLNFQVNMSEAIQFKKCYIPNLILYIFQELDNLENYAYNLTEANLTPNQRPHWFLLYDMKNSFNLKDLSPTSIGNLIEAMVTTDKQLLELYSAFFSKLSDNRWPWCGIDCKLDNLCKMVVTVLWEREKCNDLVAKYWSISRS